MLFIAMLFLELQFFIPCPTLVPEFLFIAVIFLSLLFLAFIVAMFNTSSQQQRNSTRTRSCTFGMFYMQHFSQVWLLQQLQKPKKSPLTSLLGQKHTLMLKLYLLLTSAPSFTSTLLQHLHASHTIAHLSVPSYTGATHSCLSHCCSLLALRCLGIPALQLSLPLHPNLSLPNQLVLLLLIGPLVVKSNQRGWVPQGSCPSSLGQ